MHLNCHGELTWLAWFLASAGLIAGYVIARVRCWWKHVRKEKR